MFTSLRKKIGNYIIDKRKKEVCKHRKAKVTNFQAAKTAGVLFNVTDDADFNTIKHFLNFLIDKDIQVVTLGFVDDKEIPEAYLMRKGFNFFCQEDLSWYYIPKNANVDNFVKPQLDLFVDLSLQKKMPTTYVANLSNSSFKVGAKGVNEEAYDLMFDIEKERSIAYLIDQITHYVGSF